MKFHENSSIIYESDENRLGDQHSKLASREALGSLVPSVSRERWGRKEREERKSRRKEGKGRGGRKRRRERKEGETEEREREREKWEKRKRRERRELERERERDKRERWGKRELSHVSLQACQWMPERRKQQASEFPEAGDTQEVPLSKSTDGRWGQTWATTHGPLLNSGHCVTSDSKQALSPGAEERHGHISLDISTFLQNHCLGSLILRWKTASLGLPPGGASGPHSDAHKRKLNISRRQTTQRCILMSEWLITLGADPGPAVFWTWPWGRPVYISLDIVTTYLKELLYLGRDTDTEMKNCCQAKSVFRECGPHTRLCTWKAKKMRVGLSTEKHQGQRTETSQKYHKWCWLCLPWPHLSCLYTI